MIFVPMRGDTHRGYLFFTDTNQGGRRKMLILEQQQ